jgi:hypothetical protein
MAGCVRRVRSSCPFARGGHPPPRWRKTSARGRRVAARPSACRGLRPTFRWRGPGGAGVAVRAWRCGPGGGDPAEAHATAEQMPRPSGCRSGRADAWAERMPRPSGCRSGRPRYPEPPVVAHGPDPHLPLRRIYDPPRRARDPIRGASDRISADWCSLRGPIGAASAGRVVVQPPRPIAWVGPVRRRRWPGRASGSRGAVPPRRSRRGRWSRAASRRRSPTRDRRRPRPPQRQRRAAPPRR